MHASTPERSIDFDPRLDLSPFTLFRWLGDRRPLLLIDCRPTPRSITFEDAERWDDRGHLVPSSLPTVLFDQNGESARRLAVEMRQRGFHRLFALYGGLSLYDLALDPLVVGSERFLLPIDSSPNIDR